MKRNEQIYRFMFGVLLVGFSLISGSCSKQLAHEGNVVYTQIPVESISDNQLESHDFRYAPGMSIAMAEINESLKNIEILSENFNILVLHFLNKHVWVQ
jgi:hypothetical protein